MGGQGEAESFDDLPVEAKEAVWYCVDGGQEAIGRARKLVKAWGGGVGAVDFDSGFWELVEKMRRRMWKGGEIE